jgi:hypothetical protein
MSAGFPSGFGIGCSSADSVAKDARASAVNAMADRVKDPYVLWFCFIFCCLFCILKSGEFWDSGFVGMKSQAGLDPGEF